jgi:hypothetical protein
MFIYEIRDDKFVNFPLLRMTIRGLKYVRDVCVWFQSVAADIYVLDGSFIIIRPEFVHSLLMLIHLYSLKRCSSTLDYI